MIRSKEHYNIIQYSFSLFDKEQCVQSEYVIEGYENYVATKIEGDTNVISDILIGAPPITSALFGIISLIFGIIICVKIINKNLISKTKLYLYCICAELCSINVLLVTCIGLIFGSKYFIQYDFMMGDYLDLKYQLTPFPLLLFVVPIVSFFIGKRYLTDNTPHEYNFDYDFTSHLKDE